jgi:hypothetical protein
MRAYLAWEDVARRSERNGSNGHSVHPKAGGATAAGCGRLGSVSLLNIRRWAAGSHDRCAGIAEFLAQALA